MARPQKQRCICSVPCVTGFSPQGCEPSGSINLTYDEYEVLRLLDHLQMTQEQCAQRMQISRPTVTRIYDEARRKIADMLANGRALTISPRPSPASSPRVISTCPLMNTPHRESGTSTGIAHATLLTEKAYISLDILFLSAMSLLDTPAASSLK